MRRVPFGRACGKGDDGARAGLHAAGHPRVETKGIDTPDPPPGELVGQEGPNP